MLGTLLLLIPQTVRWDAVRNIETLHRSDRLYVTFTRRTFAWRGSLLRGMFETWAGGFQGRLERKVDHLYHIDNRGVRSYQQEQLPNMRIVPVSDELYCMELKGENDPFYWKWNGVRFVRLGRVESMKLSRRMLAAWEQKGADDTYTGPGWKRTDWLRNASHDYPVGDRTYRITKSTRSLGKGARFTRILLSEPAKGRTEQVLLEVAEFQNRHSLK